MLGRSFIYALQGADLHYLPGYRIFSGKARDAVPKSKLFSSWLPEPRFFNIKFPDVLSLPHSSQCQNGSRKEVEYRTNMTLKAAEWSVCITERAGCAMVLDPYLRGECRGWFPSGRLTAPSGLIEGQGWCECWCLTSSPFRGFGFLTHSVPACCLPWNIALAWVMRPRDIASPATMNVILKV